MNRVRITAARKLLTVFILALSISACHPQAKRLRTGSLPAYWEELFDRLDMPVPQDVPGTNPQDMSLSPLLMDVPIPIPET